MRATIEIEGEQRIVWVSIGHIPSGQALRTTSIGSLERVRVESLRLVG